jgi:hypothetical protein
MSLPWALQLFSFCTVQFVDSEPVVLYTELVEEDTTVASLHPYPNISSHLFAIAR